MRNDYEVIKEIMTDSWHPDINTDEKIREEKFNEWLLTKCERYKRALKEAVDWNDKYLDEVKDNKKFEQMMKEERIGEGYKQTVRLIRELLSS